MHSHWLSPVSLSNLFTMGVASRKDARQTVPAEVCMPSEEVRLLRARLVLEEALETVRALGFDVRTKQLPPVEAPSGMSLIRASVPVQDITIENVQIVANKRGFDLETAIDDCCDTIYVATGTLLAMGVPDMAHLVEVCGANDAKFPGGKAIVDDNGKFQKPAGWAAPCHMAVLASNSERQINLSEISNSIVASRQND